MVQCCVAIEKLATGNEFFRMKQLTNPVNKSRFSANQRKRRLWHIHEHKRRLSRRIPSESAQFYTSQLDML